MLPPPSEQSRKYAWICSLQNVDKHLPEYTVPTHKTPVTSCHLPRCFVLSNANHNTRHKNGVSQPIQNGPGDHITTCSLGTGEIIRSGRAGGRGVNLTTHFYLAPRLCVELFLHYHYAFLVITRQLYLLQSIRMVS